MTAYLKLLQLQKTIDYNSSKLAGYSPYIMYLSHLLDNTGQLHTTIIFRY